jgi:hypothetical protein
MSSSDFVKGECGHCGGHLEFPTDAAGQTITCPHCGQSTELVIPALPDKNRGFGPILLGLGAAICLASVAGVFLYRQKASTGASLATQSPPAVQTNTPVAVAPPLEPQELTNDFAIMPFKLEKTPGSSLVYVTGTVKNMADQQRFGVKIAFGLSDTNDNPVGTATDYQSVLEPHGEWHFKALVIESKAVSAKFNSIQEDK